MVGKLCVWTTEVVYWASPFFALFPILGVFFLFLPGWCMRPLQGHVRSGWRAELIGVNLRIVNLYLWVKSSKKCKQIMKYSTNITDSFTFQSKKNKCCIQRSFLKSIRQHLIFPKEWPVIDRCDINAFIFQSETKPTKTCVGLVTKSRFSILRPISIG